MVNLKLKHNIWNKKCNRSHLTSTRIGKIKTTTYNRWQLRGSWFLRRAALRVATGGSQGVAAAKCAGPRYAWLSVWRPRPPEGSPEPTQKLYTVTPGT